MPISPPPPPSIPSLPPFDTCPPGRAPGLSLSPPAGPCPRAGVKNLPAGFQEGGAGGPELTLRTLHRALPPPRAPCPACTAPPAGRRCPSRTPGSGPAPTDPASACGPGSPTTTRSRSRWTVRPGRGAGGGGQRRPGKVQHRLCHSTRLTLGRWAEGPRLPSPWGFLRDGIMSVLSSILDNVPGKGTFGCQPGVGAGSREKPLSGYRVGTFHPVPATRAQSG